MYTEDTLHVISKLGITDIEVFLNCDSEFEYDYIMKLKEKADQLALNIVSVHPHTSAIETLMFFTAYDRRTIDGMRRYDTLFEMARLLGAKYFTFHGERILTRVLNVEKETRQRNTNTYRELCALAGSRGVILTQENVAWCKSADPEYLRMLRQEVPELGFTLDIKQARRARKPIADYVNAMGDALKNIHINDYSEEESCLLPGDGFMDYKTFFLSVQSAGYDGHCLIEVYSDNYSNIYQIAAAENYIKTLIRETEAQLSNNVANCGRYI